MIEELTGQDIIVRADGRPKVAELQREYVRCGAYDGAALRVDDLERTRYCLWDNQSADGRKWDANMPEGKKAFPWDGSSDFRPFFVSDGVINENAALKYAAFWRSNLRLQGVENEDLAGAATGTTFLDWLIKSKLLHQLDDEVELSAQWDETLGWFGLSVTWEREVARRLVPISFDQLTQLAQGAAAGRVRDRELAQVLEQLPLLIADEALEAEAAKAIQYVFDVYVRNKLPANLDLDDILVLSTARARKAVRELRRKRQCELPMPYLCKNQPCIRALKPYRDLLMPPETGEVQDSPVSFVRRWLTEPQLRALALVEDWDSEWVEEAVKTRGRVSVWSGVSLPSWAGWDGRQGWRSQDSKSWLIEVVWAYYTTVDEDGVTQVEYTVFSPHVTGEHDKQLAAIETVLGYQHGQIPLVTGRRERVDREISSSRGVPDILGTAQNVEKSQVDGVVDLTSIAVSPTMLIPKGLMGQDYKFGPMIQNEVVPGREIKLLDVPKSGAPLAFNTLEIIDRKVKRYFGLFDEEISPALSQLLQEPRVRKFLITWSAAFKQAWQLSLQYAPDMIERVTGQRPQTSPEATEHGYDWTLHFDPAHLNPDLMALKLDAFSKLKLEDSAGVLDAAKLIEVKARMIDPNMARELVNSVSSASRKMQVEVRDDLSSLLIGMPATVRDASDDPTAPFRLRTAQGYIQANPALAQLAANPKADPRGAQLETYLKNLQQGAVQQQNKVVGRLGVNPGQQ